MPFDPKLFQALGYQIAELIEREEKVVIDPDELAALKTLDEITLSWKQRVGESDIAKLQIAYDNESVYVADEKGQLTSLDPRSGAVDWAVNTKQRLSGGVGAGQGMILVGTSKGEMLAYNESGHLLWASQLSSEILSPPYVLDDIVVVRTVDARIYGLDAIDGTSKWVYQGATPPLTVRSGAGVAISKGAVFAGFAGGKMVAMSLFNGNVGWEAVVAQPRGVTELERMTDITSTPAIDDQLVCVAAYQGRVGCFQILDGAQIWTRESSSAAGLDMDKDYVYVSEDNGVLAAYDKYSGAGMWKQSKLGSKKLSAPLVVGHYIVVGDDNGFVNLVRNYDGVVVARSSTDETPILSQPQHIPGGFVVQTSKGGVFAFRVQ